MKTTQKYSTANFVVGISSMLTLMLYVFLLIKGGGKANQFTGQVFFGLLLIAILILSYVIKKFPIFVELTKTKGDFLKIQNPVLTWCMLTLYSKNLF
ncbi:hypothetical protein DNHGIG_36170 [Collibacillus ludicampi]|uniref:Uncharacterized protein n=1 Tax=Collibacillus ludicampi TaxID=2771369 RepID=A0AAV4LJR5_9BACL|nr:hypothetical protein [Collibacillus ludicampi]GIM48068.1 hypothetical protein DNHGIG_36170 [Collibacillus ludicampi]